MQSSRDREREQMESEDPQPGMSTFDRNHPSMFRRHDPLDRVAEIRAKATALRQWAQNGSVPDGNASDFMIEAAVLLEHAAFAIGWFRHDRDLVVAQVVMQRGEIMALRTRLDESEGAIDDQ